MQKEFLMFKSMGTRILVVGALTLMMTIPMVMAGGIIQDRKNLSDITRSTIGDEWGGSQTLVGPFLVVPVKEQVTQKKVEKLVDSETGEPITDPKTGKQRTRTYSETLDVEREPLFVLPDGFHVSLDTETDEKYRGIFKVQVYRADLDAAFDFGLEKAEGELAGAEELLWDDAELRFYLGSNRALRGKAVLSGPETDFVLEPLSGEDTPGISARVGDPRKLTELNLSLEFNGAEHLSVAPVGRDSTIEITSDWPHPSFYGAFLPDDSSIGDTGFKATWNIPHLARSLPQVSRESSLHRAKTGTAFGVQFFQPNDFYQKAYRAATYGILFIALTFMTVLLTENRERPSHPMQYIMIGLAQSLFVLLMVGYAEQIGFGPAYLLSAGAVAGLITVYGYIGLKLGKKTVALGGTLALLYAVLYLILRSADYALLAGATLAFAALAGAMFLTRNEEWYTPKDSGPADKDSTPLGKSTPLAAA
jgi:inner membrane protein